MRARLLAAAILATTSAPLGAALAADVGGAFAFKGAGLRPCGDFAAAFDARTPALGQYAGWVGGFLSGVNLFRDDTFDIAPWQSTSVLLSALAGYCRDNPDRPLHAAVTAMVERLAEDRLATASRPRLVMVGGETTVLYAAVIARLQTRLAALGLLEGDADGAFDEATETALAAFQAEIGREPTGFPDQATLFSLFDAPPAAD